MPTATQLTTHSRKGFSERHNFQRKTNGRWYFDEQFIVDSYRLTNDPEKSSLSYDGAMWEWRSVNIQTYRDTVAFCNRSAKQKGTVTKDGYRLPRPYALVLQEYWADEVRSSYLRSGSSLVKYTGRFLSPALTRWNMDRWVGPSGSLVPDVNARNRAETEALVKLKDMKVNFGEALAESRSTLSHLAKTTSTLLRAYSYARRGKWSKVLDQLKINRKRKWSTKDPASRWLELQFGWTPLLSDIKGAMELSQAGLRDRLQLLSAERNLIGSYDAEELSTVSQSDGLSSCLFQGTRGISVKLYARVKDEDIANLTSLGLTDPAQVAWALVPFSFLIDWVVPIGSYLEALGATKGLTFVSGTRTEFINGYVEINAQPISNRQAGDVAFSKLGALALMDRKTYSGFPFPLPYVKSPFSTSHTISALALIRTIALKRW